MWNICDSWVSRDSWDNRDRTTPHATIGIAPAELLMRRRPCTTLSLIFPDWEGGSIEEILESETNTADVTTSMPLLPEGENEVLPRNSVSKRQATVCYTLPVSEAELEEPEPVLKHPRR
eukprot:g31282.t1